MFSAVQGGTRSQLQRGGRTDVKCVGWWLGGGGGTDWNRDPTGENVGARASSDKKR